MLSFPTDLRVRSSFNEVVEVMDFEPDTKLVVIRTYQRGIDADIAKSVLEAAGIPSLIRGDVGRRYYYGYGLALKTGIELLVRSEDVVDAEKILDLDLRDPDASDPAAE
jgi:hypothetical protein